jgi:hypothetical protein
MICAATKNFDTDSCQGDSGGAGQSREPLLKGKAQYRWLPYTNLLWTAAFFLDNLLIFLHTLMRSSTVLSFSLQLVFPGQSYKYFYVHATKYFTFMYQAKVTSFTP